MSTPPPPARRGEGRTGLLLRIAIAVPFVYFGTVLLASLFYPGYSHMSQYASELGSASARYPWIFNGGILLTGGCAIVGAFGLLRGVRQAGLSRIPGALVALATALFGIGMLFGAAFPMPDERHGGYGLGLAAVFGPLLAALTLRARPSGLRWVTWVLTIDAIAIFVLFAIMMGVGQLVTLENVGAFQRAFALSSIPWIGLTAWAVLRAATDTRS